LLLDIAVAIQIVHLNRRAARRDLQPIREEVARLIEVLETTNSTWFHPVERATASSRCRHKAQFRQRRRLMMWAVATTHPPATAETTPTPSTPHVSVARPATSKVSPHEKMPNVRTEWCRP
jgi:hypothetical protein